MSFFSLLHTVLVCLRLYFLLSFCFGQHAGCWKLIYWQRFRFFHYAAHMLPGWVCWKQPLLAYISLKTHHCLHSALWKKLLFSTDCNDLCCPLLEVDDRGHVHFNHAAYCIAVMSISRWVADLLSYPGWGVQRHKWSIRSRWDWDGWEEDETELCV